MAVALVASVVAWVYLRVPSVPASRVHEPSVNPPPVTVTLLAPVVVMPVGLVDPEAVVVYLICIQPIAVVPGKVQPVSY